MMVTAFDFKPYSSCVARTASAPWTANIKPPGRCMSMTTVYIEGNLNRLQVAQMKSTYVGVHWKVPTIMAASLIVGVLFALGHHIFYSRLEGRIPDDKDIYRQSTNIAIGTLCSHVVRASSAIAIGVAYWQLFWQTAKSRAISIGALDSLAGVLNGAQNFFDFKAVSSGPYLMTFALLSWLIPWAMIIPPGTLSVVGTINSRETDERLRVPAFLNPDYLNAFVRPNLGTTLSSALPEHEGSAPYGRYLGYSRTLFQTAMGMAFSGDIPPVQPPHANASTPSIILPLQSTALKHHPI